MLRVGASFSLRIFVSQKSTVVLYGVFVGFHHLLYHLTADGTSFLGGKIAVVTLLEVYANFIGSFHLEFVHCIFCFGNHGFVVVRHDKNSPLTLFYFQNEFVFYELSRNLFRGTFLNVLVIV